MFIRAAALLAVLLLGAACNDDPDRRVEGPAGGGGHDGGQGGGGSPDGGAGSPGVDELFETGTLTHEVTPRAGFGTLRLRALGGRVFSLETSRDAARRWTRRLVAREGDAPVFVRDAEEGELFTDFAVHPSGEVTLAIERTAAASDAYDMLRLAPDGTVLGRTAIPSLSTFPAGDLTGLPSDPFLYRSRELDALTDGWLRVEAVGEALATAFMSTLTDTRELGTAVAVFDFAESAYAERWARIVDGRHQLIPPVWQYDEFRWREVLQRPLLAVDDAGVVVVGRTWARSRCRTNARTFGEFTEPFCGMNAGPGDHRNQPFAYTSFDAEGRRLGTRFFAPEVHDEFLVFDMAVRGDAIAIVGSAARGDADGGVPLYPHEPGAAPIMVQYDAYAAVLDRGSGLPRFQEYVSGGRGDYFAAVKWVEGGLVAAGATGWDRWNGGMSISRGADPLLAFVSVDGSTVKTRTVDVEPAQRHHPLLALEITRDRVLAAGLSDAPMTHSGDRDVSQLTFGGLNVTLR